LSSRGRSFGENLTTGSAVSVERGFIEAYSTIPIEMHDRGADPDIKLRSTPNVTLENSFGEKNL
jgi:hypothetical protein